MDKTKIMIGKYKYTELCDIIGEQRKTDGRSKTCQLREWARYFDFEKDGRYIIINSIYDEVLPKIDGRGKSENCRGNADKFGDSLKNTILLYLCSEEPNPNYTMSTYMIDKFKILNDNYRNLVIKDKREMTIKHLASLKYSPMEIYECYGILKRVVNDQFYRALNNLERENVITYNKVDILSYANGETLELDECSSKLLEEYKQKALSDLNLTYFTTFNSTKNRENFTKRFCEIVNSDSDFRKYISGCDSSVIGTWRQIKIKLSDEIETDELTQSIKDDVENELADSILRTVNNKTIYKITEDIFFTPRETRTNWINKRNGTQ